jgi:hypothetical protein
MNFKKEWTGVLRTKSALRNVEQIDTILKELVQNSYDEVREEGLLLCMECGDVDLYIAASHHEVLQEAINCNFQFDEYGEVIERDKYQQLMDDLYEYFLTLHIESGYFDYFPAGKYEVDGDMRESETDMLAPKDQYYAPFEDALK